MSEMINHWGEFNSGNDKRSYSEHMDKYYTSQPLLNFRRAMHRKPIVPSSKSYVYLNDKYSRIELQKSSNAMSIIHRVLPCLADGLIYVFLDAVVGSCAKCWACYVIERENVFLSDELCK
jgi:hypothetical protein